MARKKVTKKKRSTKLAPTPSKKPSLPVSDEEADSLVESHRQRTRGCLICRSEGAAESLRAILRSMARKRAYRFPIREMLAILQEKHPDAEIGQRSLERHLQVDERDLYDKARGRA